MNVVLPQLAGFGKCPTGVSTGGSATDEKFFQRITDVLDDKEEAAHRDFVEHIDELGEAVASVNSSGGVGGKEGWYRGARCSSLERREEHQNATRIKRKEEGDENQRSVAVDDSSHRQKTVGFSGSNQELDDGNQTKTTRNNQHNSKEGTAVVTLDVSESVMSVPLFSSSASTVERRRQADHHTLASDRGGGGGGGKEYSGHMCDPLYPASCLTSRYWKEYRAVVLGQRMTSSEPQPQMVRRGSNLRSIQFSTTGGQRRHSNGKEGEGRSEVRLSPPVPLTDKEKRMFWLGTFPLLEPIGPLLVIPVVNRKIVKNGILALRSIFLEMHQDVIVPQFVLAESSQLEQFAGLPSRSDTIAAAVRRHHNAQQGPRRNMRKTSFGIADVPTSLEVKKQLPTFSSFLICAEKQLLQGGTVIDDWSGGKGDNGGSSSWSGGEGAMGADLLGVSTKTTATDASGSSIGSGGSGTVRSMVASVLHTVALNLNVILDERQFPRPLELMQVPLHIESSSSPTATGGHGGGGGGGHRKSTTVAAGGGTVPTTAAPQQQQQQQQQELPYHSVIAVTNATHLLPPLFPVHVTSFEDFMSKRFRPEFLRDYSEPLCSTTFYASCPVGSQDVHKLALMRAMLHLLNVVIPRCAWSIDREAEPLYGEHLCRRLHMYGVNLQFLGWLVPWLQNPDSIKAVYTEITARSYRHVEAEQARRKCMKMLERAARGPGQQQEKSQGRDTAQQAGQSRKVSLSGSYNSKSGSDIRTEDGCVNPFKDSTCGGSGSGKFTKPSSASSLLSVGSSSASAASKCTQPDDYDDEEEDEEEEESADEEDDDEDDGVEFQAITREAMNRYFPYHLRVPLPKFHPSSIHLLSRMHPRYGIDVDLLELTQSIVASDAATGGGDQEPADQEEQQQQGQRTKRQQLEDLYKSEEFVAAFESYKTSRKEQHDTMAMSSSCQRHQQGRHSSSNSNTSSKVPSAINTPRNNSSPSEDEGETPEETPELLFPCLLQQHSSDGSGSHPVRPQPCPIFGVDLEMTFDAQSVPPTPDFAQGFEYESLLLPEMIDGEKLEERIGELCSRKKVMALPGKFQNLMRERILEITPADSLTSYADHLKLSLAARRSYVDTQWSRSAASSSPSNTTVAIRLVPLLRAVAIVQWSLYPCEVTVVSVDERAKKLGLTNSTAEAVKRKDELSEHSCGRQALEIVEIAQACKASVVRTKPPSMFVKKPASSSSSSPSSTGVYEDFVSLALLYLGLIYFETGELNDAATTCSEALQIVAHPRIKLRILMLMRDLLKVQNKARFYMELVDQLAIIAPTALNIGHPLRTELIPRQAHGQYPPQQQQQLDSGHSLPLLRRGRKSVNNSVSVSSPRSPSIVSMSSKGNNSVSLKSSNTAASPKFGFLRSPCDSQQTQQTATTSNYGSLQHHRGPRSHNSLASRASFGEGGGGSMVGFASYRKQETFLSHGIPLSILDLVRQRQSQFLAQHFVPYFVNQRCFEVSGTGQSVSHTYALILSVVNGFLNGVGSHKRLKKQECLVYIGAHSKTSLLAEILDRILNQRPFTTSVPPAELAGSVGSPRRKSSVSSTVLEAEQHMNSPMTDLLSPPAGEGKINRSPKGGVSATSFTSMSSRSTGVGGGAQLVPIYLDAAKHAPLDATFLERALAPLSSEQIQLLESNPKILLLVDGVGEGPKGLGGLAAHSGILRWKCKKIFTVKAQLVDHMSEKQLFDTLFPHDIVRGGGGVGRNIGVLTPQPKSFSPEPVHTEASPQDQRPGSTGGNAKGGHDQVAKTAPTFPISLDAVVAPTASLGGGGSVPPPAMHFLPLSPRDAERYTLKSVTMFRGTNLSHRESELLIRQYHRSSVFSLERAAREHEEEGTQQQQLRVPYQFSSVTHNPDNVIHSIRYRMPKLFQELSDPLLCALVASVAEDVLKYEANSGWICSVDVLDAIVLKNYLLREENAGMREEAARYATFLAMLMNINGTNTVENPLAAQYQYCLPLTINPSTHMVSFVHPIFASYFIALKLLAEVSSTAKSAALTPVTPYTRIILTDSFIEDQKADARKKTEGNLKALLLSGFSASRSQGTVLKAVEKFKSIAKTGHLSGGEWLCSHSLSVMPDRDVLTLLCDRALTIESFKMFLWKQLAASDSSESVHQSLKHLPSNSATILATARLPFSGKTIRNSDLTQAWLPRLSAVATDARCTTWNRATVLNGNLAFAECAGGDMRGLDLGAPVKMSSKKAIASTSTASTTSSTSCAAVSSCILCVAFPPNTSNTVVAGADNGSITKWDVETGQEGAGVNHGCAVSCLCFSEDGSRLVSGSLATQSVMRVWNAHSLKLLAVLEGHEGRISACGFVSHDILVSGGFDWTVRLWNINDIENVNKSGRQLSGSPLVPKVSSQKGIGEVSERSRSPTFSSSRASPLSKRRASSPLIVDEKIFNQHGQVKIRRAVQVTSFLTLTQHDTPVTAVAVSRVSNLVASLSGDGMVHVCESGVYAKVATFKLPETRGANAIAFDADGVKLAVPTRRGVSLIDPLTGVVLRSLGFSGDGTDVSSAITFSPDGILLAAAQDQKLVLWNTASGVRTFDSDAHAKRISALAFSPAGTVLVSGGWDGVLRVWPFAKVVSANNEKSANEFQQDYKFLRSGNRHRHVVCVTQVGQIDVRDAETGTFLGTCGNAEFDVVCTAADVSSDLVAVGNTDLYVTSLFKRIRPRKLKSHNRAISGLGFLPRSQNASVQLEPVVLLSVSLDRSFRLWDANLGVQLMSHTSDTPTCSLAVGQSHVLSVTGFPSTRSLMMETLKFNYYPTPAELERRDTAASVMPSPQPDRLEHFLPGVSKKASRKNSLGGTGKSTALPPPEGFPAKPTFVKQLKLNVSVQDANESLNSLGNTPALDTTATFDPPSSTDDPLGVQKPLNQPMSLRSQRTLVLLCHRYKSTDFQLSTSRILSFLSPVTSFDVVGSAGPIKTPVKEGAIRSVLACGDNVGALSMDKYLSIWNLEKKECVRAAEVHTLPITGLDATGGDASGGMVATSSQDGSVLVAKITGERVVLVRPAYQRQIVGVRFTPGNELLTCGSDRVTRKWNLNGAKCAVGNCNPFASLSPSGVRHWLKKNGLGLLERDLEQYCCGGDLIDFSPEEVSAKFFGVVEEKETPPSHPHRHHLKTPASTVTTPGMASFPLDRKKKQQPSSPPLLVLGGGGGSTALSSISYQSHLHHHVSPEGMGKLTNKMHNPEYRKQINKLKQLLSDVRAFGNKMATFTAVDDVEITSSMFERYSSDKVVLFAEKTGVPAMARILGMNGVTGSQLLQMSLTGIMNVGSLDWEDLAIQVTTEMTSVRQKLRDSFAEKSSADVLLFAKTKSPSLQIALMLLHFSGVQLLDRTNFVFKATHVCHECKSTIRDLTSKCAETGKDHTQLQPIPDRETSRHLQRLAEAMKENHTAECGTLQKKIRKFPDAELSCGIHWHKMTGDSGVLGVLVFHVPSMGAFGPQLVVNEASLTISSTDRIPPRMVAVMEKSSRTITQLAGIKQVSTKYSASSEDLPLPSGWKKVPIAHHLVVEMNTAAGRRLSGGGNDDVGIGSPSSGVLSPHSGGVGLTANASFAKYSFAAGNSSPHSPVAPGQQQQQQHMYQYGSHVQLAHPTMPKSQNIGISGTALVSNIENVHLVATSAGDSSPSSPGSPMSPYGQTRAGNGTVVQDERIPPRPEHFFKQCNQDATGGGSKQASNNTFVADVTDHVRNAVKRKEKYIRILVVAQTMPDPDVYFYPSERPVLNVNFFHADKLCGCKATTPPANVAQPLKPIRIREYQSDASSSTANPSSALTNASLLCDRFCNIDSVCSGHSCSFTTEQCRKAPYLVWQSLESEGGNYFSTFLSKVENMSNTNVTHTASHSASAFGNAEGPKPVPAAQQQKQQSSSETSKVSAMRRRSSLRGSGAHPSALLNDSMVGATSSPAAAIATSGGEAFSQQPSISSPLNTSTFSGGPT